MITGSESLISSADGVLLVRAAGAVGLDLAVVVSLGADCAADTALVRAQPEAFGPVASNPTVSQLIDRLAAAWTAPASAAMVGVAEPIGARNGARRVVRKTQFKVLHPHDFRHYVADVLDAVGLTARQIADYLGHERISTTQDEYMERGARNFDGLDDL